MIELFLFNIYDITVVENLDQLLKSPNVVTNHVHFRFFEVYFHFFCITVFLSIYLFRAHLGIFIVFNGLCMLFTTITQLLYVSVKITVYFIAAIFSSLPLLTNFSTSKFNYFFQYKVKIYLLMQYFICFWLALFDNMEAFQLLYFLRRLCQWLVPIISSSYMWSCLLF